MTDQLVGFPGAYVPRASPDWRLMASVNTIDGRAAVRELPSLAMVTPLPSCATPTGFSPDGSLLVLDGRLSCATEGGALFEPVPGAELRSRVVEIPSGREVLDLGERRVTDAAFNPAGPFPAGRYLAVNIGYETVEIYDMMTEELPTSLDFAPANLVYRPSFDPQGRWLAGGSADGTVWVLDLAAVVDGTSGADALILNQGAHTTAVPNPALSAEGILATRGFGDGLVRLWDVETGDMIVELRADETQGFAVAFSPDGSYLYYADTGNVLRRYPLDTDELIELAESRLTRGFTADECDRYFGSPDCP